MVWKVQNLAVVRNVLFALSIKCICSSGIAGRVTFTLADHMIQS